MSVAFGVDWVTLAAIAVALVGVVGSIIPGLPGAPLSLGGVLTYWWHSGYTEPGTLALAGFVLLAVLATAADLLGGAVAARAGGADLRTSLLAGGVGLVLFFVAGPFGVLLGVAGTVFGLEFYRGGGPRASARAAAYATVGMLGSVAVQFVVTVAILIGLLFVVFG